MNIFLVRGWLSVFYIQLVHRFRPNRSNPTSVVGFVGSGFLFFIFFLISDARFLINIAMWYVLYVPTRVGTKRTTQQ